MTFFRQNRRFIAWFACLAIVLSSLAPAISHAMASGQGSTSLLMEICSAAGNKSVIVTQLDFEKPSDNQDSKTVPTQHCPYCLTHAGAVGLIPDAQLSINLPDVSYSIPELFYHSPYPLFAWAASNPRAPPISS